MAETMLPLQGGLEANTGKALVPLTTVATANLTDRVLNNSIQNAAPRRKAMSFFDNSGNVISRAVLTLNPQKITRASKAVEAELPTMASWHTYRWMVEPPVWELVGYGGFLGNQTLQLIVDLDGQDNINWDFPFCFATPRNVKVISSQVQYNNPYSVYYQIMLRELPVIVRNYQPVGLQPFKTTSSFISPNFDSNPGGTSTDTWTITNEKDLTVVVQHMVQQGKSKLSETVLLSQIIYYNQLKNVAWPADAGPTRQTDGEILTELTYPR